MVEQVQGKAWTKEAIEDWLITQLAERLEIERHDIDVRLPLINFGLGSAEAVILSGDLSELLECRLSPMLVWEYPTIESIASYLAARRKGKEGSFVIDESHRKEPIAVIGVSCRFPGAENPQQLWDHLVNGVDSITEIPPDRWNVDEFYSSDRTIPGKMITRWGGFLEDIDRFDAGFFGISPREAERIDPQQRILLELSWEALADAGQVPERLAGEPVGVFIGISMTDYGLSQIHIPELGDVYNGTGSSLAIAANRISYYYDFRGPSVSLDTACSSSLVAVHLACHSLWNEESSMALAGASNLILEPGITINLSKAGMLSPDGRCKAFDAGANGYVRGEGAGIVVLKTLSRAISDGDNIYALIRGSAVNQGGRSNGITAPTRLGQEKVILEACRQAAVSPGQLQYVELHGTGTPLGDPIEAQALGNVLAIDRPEGDKCIVATIKTNIGHLEAAAGIAGLIKTILALKYRMIPPMLHFHKINPNIPIDELPIRIAQCLEPWPESFAPALAGVSSFGFGGTNAHIIVEEVSGDLQVSRLNTEQEPEKIYILPISARSPKALKDYASSYLNYLENIDIKSQLVAGSEQSMDLRDLCNTAGVRRGHDDFRLAVVAKSQEELETKIKLFVDGTTEKDLFAGCRTKGVEPKVVFVFSGQGPQWWAMGRQLYGQEPVFRETIERCDQAMSKYADWSLTNELLSEEADSKIDLTEFAQPVVWAVQMALAELWRSWGITPGAVVGHSMGEVAAACIAGILSLEDAAKVIFYRGKVMEPARGQGKMALVGLPRNKVEEILSNYRDQLCIAAVNSPSSVVLSGDIVAFEKVIAGFEQDGVYCRRFPRDYAFHSHQMEPFTGQLEKVLHRITPRVATIPFYSTVYGRLADTSEINQSYWVENMRQQVKFYDAIRNLISDGYSNFLEISPHPVLTVDLAECQSEHKQQGVVLHSLNRKKDEAHAMLSSLANLYTLGFAIDWKSVFKYQGNQVDLPAYPWQRERYWLETKSLKKLPGQDDFSINKGHPLLGNRINLAYMASDNIWQITLNPSEVNWLKEYRISGYVSLPETAYLEMVLAALGELSQGGSYNLTDIVFPEPIVMQDGLQYTVQVVVSNSPDGTTKFFVYGRNQQDTWILCAKGNALTGQGDTILSVPKNLELQQIRSRCPDEASVLEHFMNINDNGLTLGRHFRSVDGLWLGQDEVLAHLSVPDNMFTEHETYKFHPAHVSGCLHLLTSSLNKAKNAEEQTVYLPVSIKSARVFNPLPQNCWWYACLNNDNPDPPGETCNFYILDEKGQTLAELVGVKLDELGQVVENKVPNIYDGWFYDIQWKPQEREHDIINGYFFGGETGHWLIFADESGLGDELINLLEQRSQKYIIVRRGNTFSRISDMEYQVSPDREDLCQLFESSLPVADISKIIYLWGLDLQWHGCSDSVSFVDALHRLTCHSVIWIIQSLINLNMKTLPHLWLITQGSQRVTEEIPLTEPGQAALWGIGRSIIAEHQELWGGSVETDPGIQPQDNAVFILDEINNPSGDEHVALRGSQRYVARMVKQHPASGQIKSLQLHSEGSYLITGGLGDLGLLVGTYLADKGVKKIILISRTGLPPRSNWDNVECGSKAAAQIESIRKMEEKGTSVRVAALDIADEKQFSCFLKELEADEWTPIHGVVHCAGITSLKTLAEIDEATIDQVMTPKVAGTLNLHNLLKDQPLDFFVLFSSVSSLIPPPCLAPYAAANAFLDALAHYRQNINLPALSINWAAWNEIGMAARLEHQGKSTFSGIKTITPKFGIKILDFILNYNWSQVGVFGFNWSQMLHLMPKNSKGMLMYELVREVIEEFDLKGIGHKDSSMIRKQLLTGSAYERRLNIQSYICEILAGILKISPSRLDKRIPITSFGMDSFIAVQFKNQIEVDLEVVITLIKFLEGPSLEQVADIILEQLSTDEYSFEDIQDLSDEEVDLLLNELLVKKMAQ
jgi:acyl transferase domain-containing protein/acyl carrier protein